MHKMYSIPTALLHVELSKKGPDMGGTHIFLPNHNEDLIILYCEGLIQRQFLQSMETLYYNSVCQKQKNYLKCPHIS